MNNGILAPQPFSVTTDLVGIKPLLGVPQTVPTPYHLPTSYDWTIGNSDGTSNKDLVYLIDTTILGNTTVSIPLRGVGGTVLSVDWGDGSTGAIVPIGVSMQRVGSYETVFILVSTVGSSISHAYVRHGIYKITIKGVMTLDILNSTSPITRVLSYGDYNWRSTSLVHPNVQSSLIYVPPAIPITVTNIQACFQNNTRFNHPNVSLWDVSRITNMQQAFAGATSFNQNLNNWADKVAGVSNFASIFSVATNFDGSVSDWNLGVTTCNGMFFQASNFTGRGITTWKTSGVTNMQSMFFGCPRLYIRVSGDWNWNTSNTTIMDQMFYGSRLENTSFSGWICRDTSSMFQVATLNNCNFIDWKVSGNPTAMFYNCGGSNNYLPGWDLRGTTNLNQMFYNSNITRSGLDDWNVSGVTNMSNMFQFGSDFMTADLSNWDISKVTNFTLFMLRGAASPNARITINNWQIPSGAILTGMLGDPVANKWVSLSGWSFGGNSAASMFQAYNFTTAANTFNNDLTTWNTSGITNTSFMFRNCGSFVGTGVNGDLRNWNTSNVTDMSNMFEGCWSLNTSVSGWDTSKVTNMGGMFLDTRFVGFLGNGLETWNTTNVTNMNSMFRMIGGYGINVNLSGWNTGKVTNMANMFSADNNFIHRFAGSGIDNWNVTGVTTINGMFNSNNAINTTLKCNLSGWNLCDCTDMTNFMRNCNIGSGNYDILLNSWATTSTGNPVKPWATGINVHFGTVKYTAASSGARQRLVNYGWTITDGGFQA